MTLKTHAKAALVALLAAPAVACSSTPSAPADPSVGTVQAAVSTVGPDGATYSLPPSSWLFFQNPANPGFGECRQVNATTSATQTFSLPAGSYNFFLGASCSGADAGTNIPFTLTRSGDGGATYVSATLVNPEQSVGVMPGGTTSVAFRFIIQNLGPITMGTGSAVVSITADAGGTVAPTSGSVATTSWGPTSYTSYAGTPAALNVLMSSQSTAQVQINMASLSPFKANLNDEACATFTPTVTAMSASAGYTAFFQELAGASLVGQICFEDPNDSTNVARQVNITVQRSGTPLTTAMQSALGATSSDSFYFIISAQSPTQLYDGSTLFLDQFAAPVTLGGLSNSAAMISGAGGQLATINGSVAAVLTLSP
jgi:hypothetical protein